MEDTKIIDLIKSPDSRWRSRGIDLIYELCYAKIESLVMGNSGSKEDAKDIFQEGIVIFYNQLLTGAFKGDAKISTYIYSVCRNVWYRQLKKIKKHDTFLSEMTLTSEDHLSGEVNVNLLTGFFNKLKEDCKAILIAFYYEKNSIMEMQGLFGMNSTQVMKNKKGRCLKYLMNIIKESNLSKVDFYE